MSNTITHNAVEGEGAGVYLDAPCKEPSCVFIYNTVVGNIQDSPGIAGVAINGIPQFQYNNLYGNSDYDVVVLSSRDIGGANNYWARQMTGTSAKRFMIGIMIAAAASSTNFPYLRDPAPAHLCPRHELACDFTGDRIHFGGIPSPLPPLFTATTSTMTTIGPARHTTEKFPLVWSALPRYSLPVTGMASIMSPLQPRTHQS